MVRGISEEVLRAEAGSRSGGLEGYDCISSALMLPVLVWGRLRSMMMVSSVSNLSSLSNGAFIDAVDNYLTCLCLN